MKVSLIIPVYNGMKYFEMFEENIVSFYNDERFEIIIVDDGSCDDFGQRIKTKFPDIKYQWQENQGSGIARNTGLSLSSSEWIMYMDVDDNFNKKELQAILENPEKLVDINYFLAKRVFRNKNKKDRFWKPDVFKENFIGQAFEKPQVIVDSIVMNKIFKKQFLLDSGALFPAGKYEDKIFLTELLVTNPIVRTQDVFLYEWSVFENSQSQTNVKDCDDVDQRFVVCAKQLELTKGTPLFDEIYANVFNHDIMLYSQRFSSHDEQIRILLFEYFCKFKDHSSKPKLSKRGSKLYDATNYKQFCEAMNRLDNTKGINRIKSSIMKHMR